MARPGVRDALHREAGLPHQHPHLEGGTGRVDHRRVLLRIDPLNRCGRCRRERMSETPNPHDMNAATTRSLEWPDRLAKLYTPVVADVLDKIGFRHQSMHARIRPLWPEAKAAGFALTVQTVPARELAPAHPYAGELAAVDSLRDGDVLVVSESAWSFWGELLSTAANYRGCRGVVLDGPTRDSRAIRRMNFPVFHVGFHPADSLGPARRGCPQRPDRVRQRARLPRRSGAGRPRWRGGRAERRGGRDAPPGRGKGQRRESGPQGAGRGDDARPRRSRSSAFCEQPGGTARWTVCCLCLGGNPLVK